MSTRPTYLIYLALLAIVAIGYSTLFQLARHLAIDSITYELTSQAKTSQTL